MRNFILLGFSLAFFTACIPASTPNTITYTLEQSENLGFNVPENSVLENPPSNKIRIYGLREHIIRHIGVSYDLYFQYNPSINSLNYLKAKKYELLNFIGSFTNGAKFFDDLDADKPIMLMSMTEKPSYLNFTPQAGRIYCVKGGVGVGNFGARPNLEFLGKETCEKLYEKIE